MSTAVQSPARLVASSTLAVALLAISASASALPAFTFDPGAIGLTGATFTADNLLISDYATVLTSGASFTESGFLRITGAQLNDTTLSPTGLNSAYTLYVEFTGAGTMSTPTSGTFSSLNYTMWAYNGTATFGFSGTTPITSASGSGKTMLATGSLVEGGVSIRPSGGSFATAADASLTFNTEPSAASFFAAPSPVFYNQTLTSFTNSRSQVQAFAGGFMVSQGGGSINFVTVVPEPKNYALLLAGLVVVGSLAKRRGVKR